MAEQRHGKVFAKWSENAPRVSIVFFYGTLLLLLYLTYLVLVPFASPILWAAVLVVVFHPVYRRLRHVLRGRSGLTAFLLTTAVILAVMVPAILCGRAYIKPPRNSTSSRGWRESPPTQR